MRSVAIIGAGAYGTALADAAARAGREVALCARTSAAAEMMQATRNNPRLPGLAIDEAVKVVGDLSVVAGADIVLLSVPSQDLRVALQSIVPHLRDNTPVVACAKGIERGTHCFMTQIIAQEAPRAIPGILSGPNFAEDVARGLPTAVTLACADETMAVALVHALGSATFRPYHSTDVRGVEIGGAAKNVLAIAVGIAAGRDLGASAQAALTTRGFSEIMQLGLALGARAETLAGLSGLGDLILTCASPQSRNFALGFALGRGVAPDAGKLAEGVATAPVLLDLARENKVEMPVVAAVTSILLGELTIDQSIEGLLTRPFKSEADRRHVGETEIGWSKWTKPPPKEKWKTIFAPAEAGVYEFRLTESSDLILCGIGKNCQKRMRSLLPAPYGSGVRNNAGKRKFLLNNISDIEYRTRACSDRAEAASIEKIMLRTKRYIFPT